MEATYGATRFPTRVLAMSLAVLASLIIGGTGGYVVKSLATSASTTSGAASTSATPVIRAATGDAVDRSLAKLRLELQDQAAQRGAAGAPANTVPANSNLRPQ